MVASIVQFDRVRIVASIPGHLRVEVPALYRSDAAKTQLERQVSAHARVRKVRANPLTARPLILFDPHMELAILLAELGLPPDGGGQAATPKGHEEAGVGVDRSAAPAPRTALTPLTPSTPATRNPHAPMYAAWHARETDEALAFFDSSTEAGLSSAEAQVRLAQGANVVPLPAPMSSLQILINQFKSLPIMLLGVSAAVSVLTGGVAEAAAIGAVLVLNGAIGFTTERRAESTGAALSELVDDIVLVLRDGTALRIEASPVVPGDILLLAPGTRIAADLRLVETNGLLVDESARTGESFPVPKETAALQGASVLAERRNWRTAALPWPPQPAAGWWWAPVVTPRWARSRR